MLVEEAVMHLVVKPTISGGTSGRSKKWQWGKCHPCLTIHDDGMTVTKSQEYDGDYHTVKGSLALSHGKHSWSVKVLRHSGNMRIGVTGPEGALNVQLDSTPQHCIYHSSGYLYQNTASTNSGIPSYNTNSVITMNLDMNEGTLEFILDGSVVGTAKDMDGKVWYPCVGEVRH
jgi:hypothetical protein